MADWENILKANEAREIVTPFGWIYKYQNGSIEWVTKAKPSNGMRKPVVDHPSNEIVLAGQK